MVDAKSSEIAVDLLQHACLKEQYHYPNDVGNHHASTNTLYSTPATVIQCAW